MFSAAVQRAVLLLPVVVFDVAVADVEDGRCRRHSRGCCGILRQRRDPRLAHSDSVDVVVDRCRRRSSDEVGSVDVDDSDDDRWWRHDERAAVGSGGEIQLIGVHVGWTEQRTKNTAPSSVCACVRVCE